MTAPGPVRSARAPKVTGALASALLAVGLLTGCGGEAGGEKVGQMADARPQAAASPSAAGSPQTGRHKKDGQARDERRKAGPGQGEPGRAKAGEVTSGPGPEGAYPVSPAPRESVAVPSGPKVPTAELTPATGSFTKKEKRYLEDRVPRGVDPAAVLVSGKDTCQRITRTAEVDRAAAVDAIRSGEIAGAKAAITHLCPQHEELLREAQD